AQARPAGTTCTAREAGTPYRPPSRWAGCTTSSLCRNPPKTAPAISSACDDGAALPSRQGGHVLAVLCPGQGSQTAGFLQPWLAVDSIATTLDRLSTYAGFDLAATGSDDSADVVDTAVAQPLLVASGIATARLLPSLPIGTVVG